MEDCEVFSDRRISPLSATLTLDKSLINLTRGDVVKDPNETAAMIHLAGGSGAPRLCPFGDDVFAVVCSNKKCGRARS